MEYYAAIKRNEVFIQATRWMKLKNMMPTEKKTQTQRTCVLWLHILETSRIENSMETESCLRLGKKGVGVRALGSGVSFSGDKTAWS